MLVEADIPELTAIIPIFDDIAAPLQLLSTDAEEATADRLCVAFSREIVDCVYWRQAELAYMIVHTLQHDDARRTSLKESSVQEVGLTGQHMAKRRSLPTLLLPGSKT